MPKDCENNLHIDVTNDVGNSNTINDRDSAYKEENEDSDFDEATFNSNFNATNRDSLQSSINAIAKINGSNKLDVNDDNFDSVSEQSRHSE